MLSIKGELFQKFTQHFEKTGWEILRAFGFANVWRTNNKHIVVQTTDSVAFLVYIKYLNEVILVRQNRPATIDPENNPDGELMEVPAGRFDARLTVTELIAKEASEEIGATIRPEQVVLINEGDPMFLSPGIITEKQTLACVFIDPDQITDSERTFGVAEEGEKITRIRMPLDKFVFMRHRDMKTFALAMWFKSYFDK